MRVGKPTMRSVTVEHIYDVIKAKSEENFFLSFNFVNFLKKNPFWK